MHQQQADRRPRPGLIGPKTVGVGDATRAHRTRMMQEAMDRERLDALLFSAPEHFKYATNFDMDVSGSERPAVCLLPRTGTPSLILHELSEPHWRIASETGRLWATDAAFYSEHPRIRNRLPMASQWDELVADTLRDKCLHRAHIGTDGSMFPRLRNLLPHLHLEDASALCQKMRWVKHEEEIWVMRQAASLADWTQERYRENIRPGRLVADLDMCMAAMMAQEAARRMPGSNILIYCWTLSGPVSSSPHGVSAFGNLAGATIEPGDVLVNAVYPAIDGLFVENERTWFCGRPSRRQIQLFEAARSANEAACAAAIAGMPIWSIDAAAQEAFERAGVGDLIRHRTGHGLGLGGHDYPVDMPFNCAPLLPGMVFSVEPGIYEHGLGGFRHDDTVVVGSAPEIITTTARDLKSQTIL